MSLNKADIIAMYEKEAKTYRKEFLSKILVPTGRGYVYATRDYIHAMAVLSAIKKWGSEKDPLFYQDLSSLKESLPAAVNFRLNAYTPCLAYRYDELKEPDQKKLFTEERYLFTEKENGVRGWLIFNKGTMWLFSRNYSDVDCSLLEYASNIHTDANFPETFAVDVEIKFEPDMSVLRDELESYGLTTESKLEAISALLQTSPAAARTIQQKYKEAQGKDLISFRMIYPLYYKGRNYMKAPLKEGHAIYNEIILYAKEHGLNLNQIRRCSGNSEKKQIFLNSILEEGGEGVVIHNLSSLYNTSDNRSKDTFIKLKRSVSKDSAAQGMGDTIEGYISGFKMSTEGAGNEGLIGSFEISIQLRLDSGKTIDHVIAYVPNITHEMKVAATVMDEKGNPTLAPEFYDQVVEVDGQNISAKSRRLTHPRMIRFRYDKSKYECTYSEAFLRSQQDFQRPQ